MGGTYGAMAILVALMERQSTGLGKLVQNGLFETAAYIMGQHMAYSAISQETIPPMPARVSAWSIYRTFFTQEGEQVFIGITSEKHWERFCEVFARPDLAANEALNSNNQRIAERDWLLPDLEAMFSNLPKQEILQKAEAAGIPFAPIARPEDLFNDPQLNAGDSLFEVTLANGEKTKLPKLPMTIEGDNWELRRNAPAIGEDTLELLVSLGYTSEEIQSFLDKEIVAATENYQ
jgi:crotonobetainyl-CoA:carnitine CoA-transferase CaiB-like acyl-CoA transferase